MEKSIFKRIGYLYSFPFCSLPLSAAVQKFVLASDMETDLQEHSYASVPQRAVEPSQQEVAGRGGASIAEASTMHKTIRTMVVFKSRKDQARADHEWRKGAS